MILQEKLRSISKEVRVSDLINAKPIKQQLRILDRVDVLKILTAIISQGVNGFSTGSGMRPEQIAQFAKDFIAFNDHESFEDLIYTFQLMRNGYFGDFKIIDQAVIMDKFRRTLELKYQEKERHMIEESKNHNNKTVVLKEDKLTAEQVFQGYRRLRDEVIRKEEEQKKQPEIEKKKDEDRRGKYLEHLKMYANSFTNEQLKSEHEKLTKLGFTEHLEIINKYLK